MSRASSYSSYFSAFAGAAHVIPNDDDNDVSLHQTRENPPPAVTDQLPLKTRESPHSRLSSPLRKTRESPNITREQSTTIPYSSNDFAPIKKTPLSSKFCIPCTPEELQEDPSIAATRRKQLRLLTIHESLGHLSFAVLKLMARCNIIPKDLADVDPPTCPGCAYGKAHRLQWRYKGTKNRKSIRVATALGQVISMDQLVSFTPGFVPTHRGTPTNKRYIGATVFVDHFSDFTYCHLMTEMNAASTVEAKQAFERVIGSYDIKARHYHADNGLFDTEKFKQSIDSAGQTLSFCGVNAHHQNGKAERRIGDITTGARTALLHAAHRWPKTIHSSL